jgi:chemotaxis protein methyltransferase CheR
LEEALATLTALPPEAEADADVLLLRAVILTNRGQVAVAEQVCREVLALDELNAEAHYLSALCREHRGEPRAAMESDKTAIYLDSGFAMPHLHLGLLSTRTGDKSLAQRQLAQALLPREEGSRILLFGGGFSRETLIKLCRAELRSLEGGR